MTMALANVLPQVLNAGPSGMISYACVQILVVGPSYCGVGDVGGGFVMPLFDATISFVCDAPTASMVDATIFMGIFSLGPSTTLGGAAIGTCGLGTYSTLRAGLSRE